MEGSQIGFSGRDITLLLIKKATEIEGLEISGIMGKKALQKSLYFFNLDQGIFNFKWGDYGPLSGEIQQIAEDLESNGNIIVQGIETKKEGAIIKNMKFSSENNPNFAEIKFPNEIESRLNEVIRFIKGKSPRELELLASVHYWAKKQEALLDEYTPDYIFDKLTDLKPDAGFTLQDVKRALETLGSSNYL
ncbi:hypothetical protein [Candidatus Nitrosotenuis chungbukensis]|uniref:hypothetical protein n=1 Tax=Candidatus Nitrosotenuis chungbukensis TaxID=1353246 RepID=UPI0005B2C82C|nr:hypothetical protein [Candidatus Nitrosotenuis chungbukensis]